jgi:hypothetical protein
VSNASGSVVTERVSVLLRGALRGESTRWWDAEELAEVVEVRAPHLSSDPMSQVQLVLRALRRDPPSGFSWRKEQRPSARRRYMGNGKNGAAVFVYQWEARDE